MTARIAIRVQPRAARNEIVGERADAVVVRVAAPPEDGRANAAVCKLLAKRAGVARGAVTVVRGERSRDKIVEVAGVEESDLRRALGLDLDGAPGATAPPPGSSPRDNPQ